QVILESNMSRSLLLPQVTKRRSARLAIKTQTPNCSGIPSKQQPSAKNSPLSKTKKDPENKTVSSQNVPISMPKFMTPSKQKCSSAEEEGIRFQSTSFLSKNGVSSTIENTDVEESNC